MFVSVMAAHVGLDPVNDIHWITSRSPTPAELFADGRIDACLGIPPVALDLRARHVGRVANLPRHILTQGTAIRSVMRNLGGSIGISVLVATLAQNT
jgi:hypothetical protein